MRNTWTLASLVAPMVLAGCAGPLEEEELLGSQSAALVSVRASYPGSTVTVGSGDNDATWLINQSDSLAIASTRLAATVTHGDALNTGFGALDHLAIGIRGCSMDGGLQELGLPLQTGTFIFGEVVGRKVSLYNLDAMTAGRGITFWPRGDSAHCSNASRPCARFENFAEGGGLLPGSVAFDVTSAPFQVTLSADDWDTTVRITQGGVTKADFSCRSVSGNNPQCGAQAGNIAMADAFIAFVNRSPIAGRTVGATDIQVTHFLPLQ
jgi:hypothetical protein